MTRKSGFPSWSKCSADRSEDRVCPQGIAGPIPSLAPAGASPHDVAPPTARFPDITFLVYHSGYDPDEEGEEGPHRRDPHRGVSRLVTSPRGGGSRSREQCLRRVGIDVVLDAEAAVRGGARPGQSSSQPSVPTGSSGAPTPSGMGLRSSSLTRFEHFRSPSRCRSNSGIQH